MPEETDPTLDQEGLPGWRTPPEGRDPLPPGTLLHDLEGPSIPTSPDRPTTSTPRRPPGSAGGEPSPPRPPTSSRTSTDAELAGALAGIFASLVMVAGMGVNRLARRRDDLWLATSQEQQALGSSLANIASRRMPEEVTDGDGGDLITVAGVAAGYAVRNAMGVTASQFEALQRGEAPQTAPAPPKEPEEPPTAPPHRADPPATQAPSASPQTAPPTPPPPDVISPDI